MNTPRIINIVMLALALFAGLPLSASTTPVKEAVNVPAVPTGLIRITIENDRTLVVSCNEDEKKCKTIEEAISYIRATYPACGVVSIKSKVKMVPAESDRIINAFGANAGIVRAKPVLISFIVPVSFGSSGEVDLMAPAVKGTETPKDAASQLTAPITSGELRK